MRTNGLVCATGLCLILLLTHCGRYDLNRSQADLEVFNGSTAEQEEVGEEMRLVLEEVQLYIVEAIAAYQGVRDVTGLPVAQPGDTSSRSLIRLGNGACAPELNIVMIGLRLDFDDKPECRFVGKISLRIFPLLANVDLEVRGLKYIHSLSLAADINLSGGETSTVRFNFLDGRLGLNLLGIENMVLNGYANVSFGSSGFVFDGRTNAFASDSGAGFAALFQIDRNQDKREVSTCLLTGGVAMSPESGKIGLCFEF